MPTEPIAKGVRILQQERLLILELVWGAEFAVGLDSLPDLDRASDASLLDARVTRDGSHVAWPALDVELSIATLIEDAIAQARISRKRRPKR